MAGVGAAEGGMVGDMLVDAGMFDTEALEMTIAGLDVPGRAVLENTETLDVGVLNRLPLELVNEVVSLIKIGVLEGAICKGVDEELGPTVTAELVVELDGELEAVDEEAAIIGAD